MGTRRSLNVRRRTLLGAAAALALGACARRETELSFDGGWVGAAHARGHRLRATKSGSQPAPSVSRRCSVAIVGGGVAGLAAARALLQFPPDMARVPMAPNRLSDQVLVHTFEEEWGRVDR